MCGFDIENIWYWNWSFGLFQSKNDGPLWKLLQVFLRIFRWPLLYFTIRNSNFMKFLDLTSTSRFGIQSHRRTPRASGLGNSTSKIWTMMLEVEVCGLGQVCLAAKLNPNMKFTCSNSNHPKHIFPNPFGLSLNL